MGTHRFLYQQWSFARKRIALSLRLAYRIRSKRYRLILTSSFIASDPVYDQARSIVSFLLLPNVANTVAIKYRP
jgi:hypothetical protein